MAVPVFPRVLAITSQSSCPLAKNEFSLVQ
jgi:hypothetical protein